jgi:uncharacterized protein (TIGR04255 family)
MTVSFERPPLNEVVIGRRFAPLADFLVPHYGRFWSLIEEQFPTSKHAQPVADSANSVLIDAVIGLPLPRIMFFSQDSSRVVQLQGDRLLFNWRQTETPQEYPRFETLFEEYRKFADLHATFVAAEFGNALQPNRYELSYINVLPIPPEGQIASVRNTFPSANALADSPSLGTLIRFSSQTEYELPGGAGNVTMKLAQAAHLKTKEAVIRLDFVAVSPPLGPDFQVAEEQWLDTAHRAIVNGFCEVTSKEAHTKWKRIS